MAPRPARRRRNSPMPTCTLCQQDKPDEAFRPWKRKGKDTRRAECIDCEAILKERRKDNSTFVEKSLQVPASSLPRIPKLPEERLNLAIEMRMEFYKCAALDALYDLAMMPMPDNSAMAQVKFMAASRLAGPLEGVEDRGKGPTFDSVLSDLNKRFHENAPRIREVRERIVTYSEGSAPPAIEGSLQ